MGATDRIAGASPPHSLGESRAHLRRFVVISASAPSEPRLDRTYDYDPLYKKGLTPLRIVPTPLAVTLLSALPILPMK